MFAHKHSYLCGSGITSYPT